jgi:tryptophan synthase beta chain
MRGPKRVKVALDESDVPREYYNVVPDLPTPLSPPIHPETKEPVPPEAFYPLFPKEIVKQEYSKERFVPIPSEVREAYLRAGRPSPLYRATRLEQRLKTPARIYYKYEGMNPCGSHKPNTAIAQAYYNVKEGVEKLYTETGAGQWGTALSYATMLFGLKCEVYMVRVSYGQKPYRKVMMQAYGAEVHVSPSRNTKFGNAVLKQKPDHTGSLGIAISEAIEKVATDPTRKGKYSLGSVLNHVMLHQTVIGQEVRAQLALEDAKPDFVIGCIGGGSNFAGISFPLIYDKLKKKNEAEFIAVEPSSCPSTTKGRFEYDFGDTAGMTPLLKMYTLGREFMPPAIHAGGLRYHGMAPTVSQLIKDGIVKPVACGQKEVFDAAMLFARTEGIIVAPETAHAVKAAIDKALECKKKNEAKTIVFNLSGHGLLDLGGYQQYLDGKLE